jgi:hypothetical protein
MYKGTHLVSSSFSTYNNAPFLLLKPRCLKSQDKAIRNYTIVHQIQDNSAIAPEAHCEKTRDISEQKYDIAGGI